MVLYYISNNELKKLETTETENSIN